MSLLMEALRKAEEAKRRMQQQEPPAPGKVQQPVRAAGAGIASAVPLSLIPLEEPEPAITQEYILDNFASDQAAGAEQVQESYQDQPRRSRYSDRDEQPDTYPPLAEAKVPPAPERATPRTLAKKHKSAAASVFVAKQKPASSRKTMTILVAVMLLMLPVGGGLLWYLQSMAPDPVGINPAVTNYDLSTRGFLGDEPPAASATATTPQAGTVPVAATAPETLTEAPAAADSADAVTAAEATVDDAQQTAAAATAGELAVAPAETPAEAQQAPVLPPGTAVTADESAVDSADSGPVPVLEISRSGGSRTLNPDLVTAYNRLQSGDLLVAGQLYQEVLNGLPNNRDALLGLALARLRQGNEAQAGELYARLLQLNPRDPLAHAGLLQTMQTVAPAEHEAELQALLAEYPGVAPLEMALGNLYASQQRWSEAQGAYYNALLNAGRSSDGPVHPDYAFNLAVSLDRLNQKKAALDYYRQAQTLALEVTPGFDPQKLSSRLAYLEQNQP